MRSFYNILLVALINSKGRSRLPYLMFLVAATLCLAVRTEKVVAAHLPGGIWRPPSRATIGGRTPLSVEDENKLRSAVYNNELGTAFPVKGEWAFGEVLGVPAHVFTIYEKDPVGTLEVLLKIVEGGNPKDSALALGYALSVVAKTPWAGAIAAHEIIGRDHYDQLDDGWQCTPRQHWVGCVKSKLAKVRQAAAPGPMQRQ